MDLRDLRVRPIVRYLHLTCFRIVPPISQAAKMSAGLGDYFRRQFDFQGPKAQRVNLVYRNISPRIYSSQGHLKQIICQSPNSLDSSCLSDDGVGRPRELYFSSTGRAFLVVQRGMLATEARNADEAEQKMLEMALVRMFRAPHTSGLENHWFLPHGLLTQGVGILVLNPSRTR